MSLIFGLGTGRCGTHSLAHLLNSQPNTVVTHELGGRPVLPWILNEGSIKLAHETINYLNSNGVNGDVAFYWLPYVHTMLEHSPNIKFVVLKRDRQAVIDSFMKWTPTRNHWKNHMGLEWIENEWDQCFPTYSNDLTKEEAIGKYWDEYYETVDRLLRIYPDNMIIFQTEDLNNQEKVTKLLEWCGIEDIKPITNIRLATT